MQTTSKKRNEIIAQLIEMGATEEQVIEWMNDPIKLRIINALSA
jgi:hypothetical protein